MRIAIIDPEGCGTCIASRLRDEGAEVQLYVHPLAQRDVGLNLVPKTNSLHQLFAWAKQQPSIALFLSSGMGKIVHSAKPENRVPLGADEFRKAGIPTVGGGSLCDKLEKDRVFGEQVAKAVGCKVPPTKEFATIGQTIAFAKTVPDEQWFFKSDRYLSSDATKGGTGEQLVRYLANLQREHGDRVPNILQKGIKGVALSTACWWNGHAFIPPFEATIEHKAAWNDDLGPSTGCAVNAVWFYEQDAPKVVQSLKWDNLAPLLRRYDAPAGLYDMNAIVDERGDAYFLEWTVRFGWDSEPTSTRLFTEPLAGFLEKLTQGRAERVPVTTKDLSYAVRLSVPPYPFENYEQDKGSAKGVPIEGVDGLWDGHFIAYSVMADDEGDVSVADRLGLIGLSLATGTSLSKAHDAAIRYAKEDLEVPGLAFRTDGAAVLKKDAQALAKVGYEVHPGMLR